MATAKKDAAKAVPVKQDATHEAHVETTNGAAAAPAPVKAVAKTAKKPSTPASEAAAGGHIKGVSKDGGAYTKDFDVKFLTAQKALLIEEKAALTGQAIRLEDEANSLIEESEMGDVQFDDEGGEGDTMVVERERDLALSAQARQTIADIDAALLRIADGSYGYSIESGRAAPRGTLDAPPGANGPAREQG